MPEGRPERRPAGGCSGIICRRQATSCGRLAIPADASERSGRGGQGPGRRDMGREEAITDKGTTGKILDHSRPMSSIVTMRASHLA